VSTKANTTRGLRGTKAAVVPKPTALPAAATGIPHMLIVSKQPIHEQILPHIRRDIIEGRWAPGERLPEPLLCRDFGISRTPLRDALKILEAEGFVELLPHVGAVVTDPSAPDVAEKMDILSALEQLAVERVAEIRPVATLAAIRDLHARMKKAAAAHDAATYYRLNEDFHRNIVAGTGNKALMDLHERIMWHVHRARHRANDQEWLSEDAPEHHDLVVRLILKGDSAGAAQAMRHHLHAVRSAILDQHARHPREADGAQPQGGGAAAGRRAKRLVYKPQVTQKGSRPSPRRGGRRPMVV
jgi:DNA-binding GntR family transcriptional regulator